LFSACNAIPFISCCHSTPHHNCHRLLLQVLSQAGFKTAVRERRGRGWVSETALNQKRQQKVEKLRRTTQDLAVAWGLSLLCGLGHLAHLLPAAPAWLHALHHPAVAATISAAALIGAGLNSAAASSAVDVMSAWLHG
jgi:hypothetical protein